MKASVSGQQSKATGEFLGWFCLHPTEGGDPGTVDLGYRLRQTAWGKGYGTEGARALLRKGFTEFGVQRVLAMTYQDNIGSRRVMEKAGMTLVRTYRSTPEEIAAAGTFVATPEVVWDGDDVEYALEKADWERQEAAEGERLPDNESLIRAKRQNAVTFG